MERIRNRTKYILIAFFALLSILFTSKSIEKIFIWNYIGERVFSLPNYLLYAELFAVFIILEAAVFLIKDKQSRIYFFTFVISLFLWLHRAFLPVLLSGSFLFSLAVLGELLLLKLRKKENLSASCGILRFSHNFMTGSSLYIASLCVLSLFGIGGIGLVQIYSFCLCASALLIYLYLYRAGRLPFAIVESGEKKTEGRISPLLPVFIIVMLLLQAGRLNITLDYDSIHYGLRSAYILDNGRGIYESLGFVNDVYLYPKGFEILTLPLNFPRSYGFMLAFSWCMSVFILFLVFDIVRKLLNAEYGLIAAAITSLVPGIMNMGVSAKTDLITLAIQLIFIDDILSHLKEGEKGSGRHLIWAGSAALLSLIYKPTALVFSGTLFMFTMIFLLITKRFRLRIRRGNLIMILPQLSAFVLVTLRTLRLSGYPITSAFTGLWRRIGLEAKYPFMIEGMFNTGMNTGGIHEKIDLIYRLKALYILPLGEEMQHVHIAAPTVLVALLIVVAGICGIMSLDRANLQIWYIYWASAVFFLLSVIILRIIYQVDGNYFILLYALIIISAMISLKNYGGKSRFLHAVLLAISPTIVWAFILTSITNWAGAVGLTPISLSHYGYYDHRQEIKQRMQESDNREIYDFLAADPRCRVLSIAWQPEHLEFPCNVQSYTDIAGSGGNVAIVNKLVKFKEYLDFAGTEYVYAEQSFLKDHSRAKDIVGYMIEDGSLVSEIRSGGNTLYRYISGK